MPKFIRDFHLSAGLGLMGFLWLLVSTRWLAPKFSLAALGISMPSVGYEMELGYLVSSLLALGFNVGLFIIVMGYLQGGMARWCAERLALGYLIFILASTLAISGFALWQGIAITPWPWLSVPMTTLALHDVVIRKTWGLCVLLASLILLLPLLLRLASAKHSAKRIHGQAHFAGALEIHRAKLYANQGLVLAKAYGARVRLPGYESVLVVAPTGSGKTSSIAIPNLLEWQDSVIVNDIKGELFAKTAHYRQQRLGQSVYCFSPCHHDHTTHRYNPFAYVSVNPERQIRDLQVISEILIPATKWGDAFWYQSARELFILLSLYLIETQSKATLQGVYQLAYQETFVAWLHHEVLAQSVTHPVFLAYSESFLQSEEKTQKNILKDFQSRLSLFADPQICQATSGNDFDLRTFRKNPQSVYLNIPVSDMTRLRPLLTLFWHQFIDVMTQQEPDAKQEPYGVLALLDEFGNLAKLDALQKGLSYLRSYHIRCVVLVQYLTQITAVYGKDEGQGFLNTKVKVCFALSDHQDAKFFAEALGQKTVRITTQHVSQGAGDHAGHRSSNISYSSRALMTADEILQLKYKQVLILIEAQAPIKATKNTYFKQRDYQQCLKHVKPKIIEGEN